MRLAMLQNYQGELTERMKNQPAVYIQSTLPSQSMKYRSPPRLHARAVVDVAGCCKAAPVAGGNPLKYVFPRPRPAAVSFLETIEYIACLVVTKSGNASRDYSNFSHVTVTPFMKFDDHI